MISQVRPQPSPGPSWETLSVPQDTPDASDVEDTDVVELQLLGTPRKRKEQAIDIGNDAKRARYRVSQGRRESSEFNPPSSIQVASRQHPSPSITRTGRGIEVHSVLESSKRTNVTSGIASGNSGNNHASISTSSGTVKNRRDAVFITHSGQSISRPDVARKRTARKYATSALKSQESISVPSAGTRPVQRTKEEKQRQNSLSSSSDSLPYSPTAPVKIPNGVKTTDQCMKKTSDSFGSGRPVPTVGSCKSAAPRRTPAEIIDITSDGESTSLLLSLSRAGKPAPHDIFVIDSGDESTSKRHNNARVSPAYRPTSATPKQVIEILDSDEEPISSSKIDSFEALVQDAQQEPMDELDRLSLLARQSPQDGALIPPPESASDSSESIAHSVRGTSSDSCGSEKENVTSPIVSNDDRKADMDIDSGLPAFQDKDPCARQNIQSMSMTSDFEPQRDISPTFQYRASQPNGIHNSPPPESMFSSNVLENKTFGVQVTSEPPNDGTNFPIKKPAQNRSSVQADLRSGVNISHSRKRLSFDAVDIRGTQAANGSISTKRSHSGRNLSLSSLPVSGFLTYDVIFDELQNSHEKTGLGAPRLSLGMDLADAITQASQANNRTHVRNHSRAEIVSEATGKPNEDRAENREAIEKSQMFMRMVQKPRRKKRQHSDRGVMKRESVANNFGQRTGDSTVESGSSGDSRQSSSESGILTSPEIRQQHLPPTEILPAISGYADQSNVDLDTKDATIQESDEELEYIDETGVAEELASIDITNHVEEAVEAVDGRLNDDSELTPKDVVQLAHGPTTKSISPDPMDMFNAMADGEETIPPSSTVPSSRKSTPQEATHSQISPSIKIEGLTILNWQEFRQDLNNFSPIYHLAKELPHTLQDHINHMSEWTRLLPDMRTVFTAAIQENTALDEPDAPLIHVENFVDGEPTPPWEFHYSNQMWHGEGVPSPDIKNLVSCDCIGRCDPRSKTCACVRRQQEAFEDPNAEFAYDNKGRLKELGYPIFECNDLCGCDDDCRNRVVQHGRTCAISIKKTINKGWGVFADQKKIYKGTFIGIYAGEILTDEAGEERGLKYDKLGKTYLFDIDFHHLHKGKTDWTSKYTVDAYHAGNFTRFLNHSCDPNCTLNPCYINEGNIDKPLLTVFARRDIEPGEELCFSYLGDLDDDDNMDTSDNTGDQKNEAVYAKCYCGAKNCKGRLFN